MLHVLVIFNGLCARKSHSSVGLNRDTIIAMSSCVIVPPAALSCSLPEYVLCLIFSCALSSLALHPSALPYPSILCPSFPLPPPAPMSRQDANLLWPLCHLLLLNLLVLLLLLLLLLFFSNLPAHIWLCHMEVSRAPAYTSAPNTVTLCSWTQPPRVWIQR